MRSTVVVPTYNEIENIERVCREVLLAAPDVQILVVDDGSPDGTADKAEELGRELGHITVLRRTEKNGLGNAYRAGLRRAIDDGAEICVQMDADLSHDPAVLPGGRTVNWPSRRRWLSRWGNRYAAGVLGLAINDATAGYRAYSSSALERMKFESVKAEGYGFQIEMTYRLLRADGKIVEFPITFHDRTEGVSKMSGNIIKEAMLLVLKLWVVDFRGRRRRRTEGA